MQRTSSVEISAALPSLTLRISNAVCYVLLILVNVASNTGLLGPTNAEVSRRFGTPLTPAGWAFSIWGLIFGLQGVGVVYALVPYGYSNDGWKQRVINSIGYGWLVGWIFEMSWQLFFLLETAGGMIICLGCLVGALVAFGTALYRLYLLKETHGSLSSVGLYVAFFLPTSVNAAWLSVASSVGVLVVPVSYGFKDHSLIWLAITLAVAATLLGVAVVQRERDSAYGLTLVWSFVAVYGGQDNRSVRVSALVCVSVMTAASIFSVLRRRTRGSCDSLDGKDDADLRQRLAGAGRTASASLPSGDTLC